MNKLAFNCVRQLACSLAAVALLVACCTPYSHADEPLPKGHYQLTGVKVVPIDRTEKGDEKSDRLTHWIRFDIQAQKELVKGTEAQPFKILNPAVTAKSSLTFDKPIKFKGEEVPAGTNLLKYKKFDGSFFNVHLPDPHPLAISSATITRDFQIPADAYTVKFAWTTAKGEVFAETVKVSIDVDLADKR
jgi:hypothetical protein